MRREHLHPGAQRSLFPSEHFRYWGHYTNTTLDPVASDADIRAHAHVEDHIRRLKDTGAARFPFSDLDANRAWLAVVCAADTLVRWFQHICLAGQWARAEPKRLRWQIWHAPARIATHGRRCVIKILDGWPTAQVILGAYRRIEALP